jgi:hypothetical protein
MEQGKFPEEWVTDFRRLRQSLREAGSEATSDGSPSIVSPRDLAKQFDAMFTPEVWGTLMGMAHLNSFRLHCPSLTDPAAEATCLFVQASFFNHDCSPNVEVQSPETPPVADKQPVFLFKATTGVAEGQELCISYVGERATESAQRKEQLELLSWGYGINN